MRRDLVFDCDFPRQYIIHKPYVSRKYIHFFFHKDLANLTNCVKQEILNVESQTQRRGKNPIKNLSWFYQKKKRIINPHLSFFDTFFFLSLPLELQLSIYITREYDSSSSWIFQSRCLSKEMQLEYIFIYAWKHHYWLVSAKRNWISQRTDDFRLRFAYSAPVCVSGLHLLRKRKLAEDKKKESRATLNARWKISTVSAPLLSFSLFLSFPLYQKKTAPESTPWNARRRDSTC